MKGTVWSDEQSAPPGSDLTPAELRTMAGGDFSGTFASDWQGETDLLATFTLDGAAEALSGDSCAPGMGLSGTLSFSAGDLLLIETPIFLVVQGSLTALSLTFSEADFSGDLSPGILPDDATALTLETMSTASDGTWSGRMEWHLERPTGRELAEAATWSAE
ncbi:MAG: hypothetical protein ACI8RZ_000750 [Myxococcota bacterium]